MVRKVIECEVYKCAPLFIWDCTIDELIDYLEKKENVKEDDWSFLAKADGVAMTLDTDEGILRVVWIKDRKLTAKSIARVAHEVIHLCVRILEHKGVPYDSYRNADESLAYLADFFIRKLYEK